MKRRQAKAHKSPLAVLAFEPHPAEFFRPCPDSIRLTPLRTKARLLAELGVDAMFALTFDDSMAKRSAENFVSEVLVKGIGLSGVVVGPDFEFGHGRAGNVATLKEMGAANGFTVAVFDMVKTAGEKISSTRIRDSLRAAHPEEAARLLGRFWAIEARVEHGDGRGRTMGFPTANMHLGHCLAPSFGVYAVRVTITENEKPLRPVMTGWPNFGIRPMYQTVLVEAHLFDFDGDLYGKHLSVELIAYLRPEAKIQDLDAPVARSPPMPKSAQNPGHNPRRCQPRRAFPALLEARGPCRTRPRPRRMTIAPACSCPPPIFS